ncbi:MAG: alpha/beta hydrolase [Chloroflexi bacterium]|nr:alpha/beta hydrolase [Chloroflexota bacterium]
MRRWILDSPLLRHLLFYPRQQPQPSVQRPGIQDGTIPVSDNVVLGYRCYHQAGDERAIVYFHGNGEIASDYDTVAGNYHAIGCSLLVIDYRGYGWSTGEPRATALLEDVPAICAALEDILVPLGLHHWVIMGRSLGSISTIEMAYRFPDRFVGLILESGLAQVLLVYWPLGWLGVRILAASPDLFGNLRKMRHVALPVLVIHGERDRVLPVRNGQKLYEAAATPAKTLRRLPGVGHNDLMLAARRDYFAAIEAFLNTIP